MKKIIIVLILGILASPIYLRAQTTTSSATPGGSGKTNPNARAGDEQQTRKPELDLPRFDLDFGGGPPAELVAAIEVASKTPVNVIIPEEQRDVRIPSFKMRGVNVAELFEAVGSASRKQVKIVTGTYFGGVNGQASKQYVTGTSAYGFRTSGQPRKDSVWYFYNETPPMLPEEAKELKEQEKGGRTCRFFQLAPYLESYTIEDITTALETGWKMLGEKETPNMSFHKDTKLLIVVGEPEKLQIIDQMLEQLPLNAKQTPAPAQSAPNPTKGGEVKKP